MSQKQGTDLPIQRRWELSGGLTTCLPPARRQRRLQQHLLEERQCVVKKVPRRGGTLLVYTRKRGLGVRRQVGRERGGTGGWRDRTGEGMGGNEGHRSWSKRDKQQDKGEREEHSVCLARLCTMPQLAHRHSPGATIPGPPAALTPTPH